jgi:hypothetical protein
VTGRRLAAGFISHLAARRRSAGGFPHVLRGDPLVGVVEDVDRLDAAGDGDRPHQAPGDLVRGVEVHQELVSQAGFQSRQPAGIRELGPEAGDGLVDRRDDPVDLLRVLDPREDAQQARVAAQRRLGADELHQLLVEDQLLVDVAGLAESQLGEQHRRRQTHVGGIESRGLVADPHQRQGAAFVGDLEASLALLRRLFRNLRRHVAGLPVAVLLADRGQRRLDGEVPGDQQHHVLGAVEPREEAPRVVEEPGHPPDVLLVSHRRVPVGVLLERRRAGRFGEDEERIGAVLAVLAVDRPGLGLEHLAGVGEVLEAVALELHHQVQVLAGDLEVVAGEVVGGKGVGVGADPGDQLVADVRRVFLGTAKHHVLEEVSEAGAPRLDLVPGAGADDRPVGRQASGAHRHQDDLEAVGQDLGPRFVGEDSSPGSGSGGERHESDEQAGGGFVEQYVPSRLLVGSCRPEPTAFSAVVSTLPAARSEGSVNRRYGVTNEH